MHILCVGISHRTAPVELRERVAMGNEGVLAALADLHGRFPSSEAVVLSTCNRTEFTVARPLHGRPRLEQIVDWIAETRGIDRDALSPTVYHHDNERAIRHLMRVGGGLESMVLGEHQVLGQVRGAYELACEAGTAGRVLHKVFRDTITVGKRVRNETQISAGRTSVSSVAVDFARHLFSHFDDKTLLVIGAGKMTELTLEHFRALGPGKVIVCNRSIDRAREVAGRHGGEARGFDELDDLLVSADLVISSTGAEQPIIDADRFRPVTRRRKGRPVFVIDIAVPRNFDPAVRDLSGVYLYDLDDLQQAIAQEMAGRNGEVDACEAIIESAVRETYTAIQTADHAEMIRLLREQLHGIGEEETRRTIKRLRNADPETAEKLLEEHTQRLVNKILHRPLSEIGRGDATDAAMNATALRRLFGLDEARAAEGRDL